MKVSLLSVLSALMVAGVTACSTVPAQNYSNSSSMGSAPVATISGKCITGTYDETTSTFYPLTSPATFGSDQIAEAYQIALTAHSAVANVTGFSVAFYSQGQELTSDTENNISGVITPGDSLTWTEYPWGSTQYLGPGSSGPSEGPYAVGTSGAVDTSVTCRLVGWYHD